METKLLYVQKHSAILLCSKTKGNECFLYIHLKFLFPLGGIA